MSMLAAGTAPDRAAELRRRARLCPAARCKDGSEICARGCCLRARADGWFSMRLRRPALLRAAGADPGLPADPSDVVDADPLPHDARRKERACARNRRMSRLRLHLLGELAGGYAYLALSALVTLLLVPVYVRLLGAQQWGVVALCMTVQGLLFALDALLAPPLLRDVARAAERGGEGAMFHAYLRLYAALALALFVPGQALLAWPGAVPEAVQWPLRLILVQFLVQFCNNAAIGYWNGLQQQRRASLRLGLALLAKHAAALLLLLFWRADAMAYLLPFAVLGAIEFLLNWRALRGRCGCPAPLAAGSAATAPAYGVAAYALAATLGALGGQIDRIVLSLRLPAADYGRYFLAGTVVLSLLQLQVPILRSFLPRMATAATAAPVVLAMGRASLGLVALPALLLALFAEPALTLWLGNAATAAALAPTLRLMLAGVMLLALQAPLAALLLSQRRHALLALMNGLALLAQVLLLAGVDPPALTTGGLAWLVAALVQLAFAPLVLAQLHAGRR